MREILGADIAEAFRQGSKGAALDVVRPGRPWGFRLDAITPEVLLRQDEDDTLVPPAMERHLASRILNCRATFFPGEGQLLVVDHMNEIVRAFTPSG